MGLAILGRCVDAVAIDRSSRARGSSSLPPTIRPKGPTMRRRYLIPIDR